MSYKSQLEHYTRRSVAMSVLNQLRHAMVGRTQLPLSQYDTLILKDAVELSKNQKISGKMLRYSFRGLGAKQESAAIELSDALIAALLLLSDQGDWNAYWDSLHAAIAGNDISEEHKKKVMDITKTAMDIISSQERENRREPFDARIV